MGDVLISMGRKLKILHIYQNGIVETKCLPFSNVKSISSEDYHKLEKPKPELLGQIYERLIQGLIHCEQLIEFRGFYLLFNMYFNEAYVKMRQTEAEINKH